MKAASFLTALLIQSAAHSAVVTAFAFFSTTQFRLSHKAIKNTTWRKSTTSDDATESSASMSSSEISKAPTLNGKVVLPLKAMMVGLKGHKVAAVYALLDKNYKRG